jgi:osmoprotectant transport system ATP-binding protein
MLEARSLTIRFGESVALDGVSLAPLAGRTTVLIGPSGCGKSTLLRAFIGLIAPTAGEVLFGGERIRADRLRELRIRTGYVIQEGGLFPHLTARDNITLMARRVGRDDPARVAELAALVRLEESLLDRFPSELSGGQRQRVSLMRALMLDPDALLLDEPLGALDPLVRAELQRDLRGIFRDLRKSVILVTHDLAEAAHFADHVVLMRAGRIEQQGTFHSLMDSPASEFAREFVNAQRELHTV